MNSRRLERSWIPCTILVGLALAPAARADGPDWDRLDPGEARARAEAEEAARPKVRTQGEDAAVRLRALEARVRRAPADVEARFALARLLHLRGVDGDEDAHDRAVELLEEIARQGAPPRVQAWLGSARLLEAKYTFAFWDKGDLVKRGLALLDEAVARAPGDVEVRFLRGVACYHLPFFFERKEGAVADLALVAAAARDAVEREAITPDMAAAALFLHGLARHERGALGEAQTAWRLAVELAPRTAHARAAAERLGGR